MTEQKILQKLVIQLKEAHPGCTWMDELDTTSTEKFKNSYSNGTEWGRMQYESFIDLFGCGCEYQFDFTEDECQFIYDEFDVFLKPLDYYAHTNECHGCESGVDCDAAHRDENGDYHLGCYAREH